MIFSRGGGVRTAPPGHQGRNRPLSNLGKMLSLAYSAGGTNYQEDAAKWTSPNVGRMRVCGLAHTYFRNYAEGLYPGERINRGMVPSNVVWRDGSNDSGGALIPNGFTMGVYDDVMNIVISYPSLNPDVWEACTVYVVVIREQGLVDGRNDNVLNTMFQPTGEITEGLVSCEMPVLDGSLTGTSYMISTGVVFYGDSDQRGKPTIANGCNCMGVFAHPWS